MGRRESRYPTGVSRRPAVAAILDGDVTGRGLDPKLVSTLRNPDGLVQGCDQRTHSKGTMSFVLHPHVQSMTGRWVVLSYDGAIATGWASMAKTQEEAQRLMHEFKQRSLAPA